jgi:phage gpG-like protein
MTVAVNVEILGAARVQRVISRLGHLQLHDLLDNIGNMVANQTRRRILHDKEAPDGTEWKPLSPPGEITPYERYKRRVRPGIGLLEFDGHLRDSITHVVSGDQVAVGSNLVYARRQHEMRPFIGLSAENEDDIEQLVRDWIATVAGVRV